MDVFECIQKRYTYRGAYLDTPVPREHLEKIIKAGLAAPSGNNRQTTSLIGIDDRRICNAIIELVQKNGFRGKAPPAGICVLTQPIPVIGNICLNIQDYAAAMENMLLAITALGYISCWIEGRIIQSAETQMQIAKFLNIPDEYTVVGFLPIGVPESEGKRPQYKPFHERAWFNNYGNNK